MVLALVFFGLYAALALIRFQRFVLNSWDNAIFEQAIKAYAHLGAPIVPIKGPDFNLLGDHFSPVIALVAPLYRLFPSAQTILLVQVGLIAVSVGVIANVAIRHLGMAAGLAVAITYGLSFGIQSAVKAEFHEVAFAVPLLALAGAAYVDRRWPAVVWWSLPLLLVKEDLGLTVAVIGAVLVLAGQRARGAALTGAGIGGAALVLLVLVPHFNPGGGYDYTANVGGTDGIIATLLTATGQKATTVVLTLAVTGFLALRSPWVLLAVPTFAWRFVGDTPYYWGTQWHYSLILMPIVFIAMIDALVRLDRSPRGALKRIGLYGVAVAVGVTAVMQLHSPLKELTQTPTAADLQRVETAHAVLARIPTGVTIETDIGLIGHLVTDRDVYWSGTVGDKATDYVLIDDRAWAAAPEVVEHAEKRTGQPYTLVFDRDGFALAKRVRR